MHSLAADGPRRRAGARASSPAQRSRSVRSARLLAQRAGHHGPLQAAAVLSAEAEEADERLGELRRMGGFEKHVNPLRSGVGGVGNSSSRTPSATMSDGSAMAPRQVR